MVDVHFGLYRPSAQVPTGPDGEQSRAPTRRCDQRSFGVNLVQRRVEEIAFGLPTNCRIAIHQPVEDSLRDPLGGFVRHR